MRGCEVAVQLSDKRVISSKDPRFKISSSWIPGINRVTFEDSQREIGFSLSCRALDDLSVCIELDVANKGNASMLIERIVAIKGYVARNNPEQSCKVLMTVFMGVLGSAIVRGIAIDCGCFGSEEPSVAAAWRALLRDIPVLATAFWLCWIDHRESPEKMSSPIPAQVDGFS